MSVMGLGGAGLGFASGMLKNYLNQREAKKQRKWSSKEAQKNRDFQESMSATSVQRRSKDLQKAGWNPILSVTSPGSPQPGGATAQSFQRAQMSGGGDEAGSGASSAIAVRLANIQLANEKKRGLLISRQDALLAEQGIHERNRSNKTITEGILLKNLVPGSKVEREIDESTAGNILRWTNRISSSAVGAGRFLKKGKAR